MSTEPTDPTPADVRTTPGPDTAAIDAALASLEALDELGVADHPAVFDDLHRVLRDQLAR